MVLLKYIKMGNEESHYPKIEIEDEAVEVTDKWSLHYARNIEGNVNVHSAFISQPKNSQLHQTPLQKNAKVIPKTTITLPNQSLRMKKPFGNKILSSNSKTLLRNSTKPMNLMIHRHPCIVKYVSSWNKSNKLYLITEEVKPLALILTNQSALQICVGLHSVLSALVFLHEKAKASHINVCCSAIYVTPEGIWKLGGLEYLKKFTDVTPSYLQESRASRYERAVPPEEDSLTTNSKVNAEAIDIYGFGVLVDELLKKRTTDEIPLLLEFKDFCKKKLQSSNPDDRVKLSQVLTHQFFNHDFIKISRFLFDLPIKSSQEKENFFSELTEQLYLLPEEVVGSQLASLLLSRVVLLDCTAQKHLLPVILHPKTDEKDDGVALFSESVFRRFVVPKLLQIFKVRDAQIRLILLSHFHLFVKTFSSDQLKLQVLPELLVGIKDTNDELVSMTLKALSQLVLVLGAATVIGGKRGKLFTDGRPKSHNIAPSEGKSKVKDKIRESPAKTTPEVLFNENSLPERLSPDGGEDNSSSTTVLEAEGDNETWSDWDVPTERNTPKLIEELVVEQPIKAERKTSKTEEIPPNKSLPDITSLDIKSSTTEDTSLTSEIDFFRDMEPVISKTQVVSINSSKTKFDVESDETGNSWEGWGGDWELGEVP